MYKGVTDLADSKWTNSKVADRKKISFIQQNLPKAQELAAQVTWSEVNYSKVTQIILGQYSLANPFVRWSHLCLFLYFYFLGISTYLLKFSLYYLSVNLPHCPCRVVIAAPSPFTTQDLKIRGWLSGESNIKNMPGHRTMKSSGKWDCWILRQALHLLLPPDYEKWLAWPSSSRQMWREFSREYDQPKTKDTDIEMRY